jgi:hypothetical protein
MDTSTEPNSDRVHLCIRCGLGLHPDAVVCPRCGADVPAFQAAPGNDGASGSGDGELPYTPPTFSYVPSVSSTADRAPEPEEEPMVPSLARAETEPPSPSYLDQLRSSTAMGSMVVPTPEPSAVGQHATQEWEAPPAEPEPSRDAGPTSTATEPPEVPDQQFDEAPQAWDAISPADDWDHEPPTAQSAAAPPGPPLDHHLVSDTAPVTGSAVITERRPRRGWAALGWVIAVLAVVAAVVAFAMVSHQKRLADDARALAQRQSVAVARLQSEVAALTLRLDASSNVSTGIKAALAKCRSAISLDQQYGTYVQDIVTGIAQLNRPLYDRGTAGVARLGPQVQAANNACLAGANS